MGDLKMEEKWGEWAFLIGIGISLIIGLASSAFGAYLALVYGILGLLGLIVGFLNISEKETNSFLLAGIALLSISAPFNSFRDLPVLGTFVPAVQGVVTALGVFVAPAILLVALKAIYNLASNK